MSVTDTTKQAITETELHTLLPEPGPHHQTDGPAGMYFKDTPGHGYLMVGPKLVKQMPDYMRSTKFSPEGKYEEDCDWCLPLIPMLDYYAKPVQEAIISTFYHWHPEKFERYFERTPVESYKRLHGTP